MANENSARPELELLRREWEVKIDELIKARLV
jgi:hypothetical protein